MASWGLLWNLTSRGNQMIKAKKSAPGMPWKGKGFLSVPFVHSVLCHMVYIHILHRIMNTKSFLKITHTFYTSTLNMAFLKALSLVTCFLKVLIFTYTCIFHLHVNVYNFYPELQLCISNCFLNNPRTAHLAKSILFLAPPRSQALC